MARVYHAINPTYENSVSKFHAKDFQLVAEVQTNSLLKAFELTNHISCLWWENKEVTKVMESRSTSVGDIVETKEGFFVCRRFSWEKIEVSE